jgi:hypothetical protein
MILLTILVALGIALQLIILKKLMKLSELPAAIEAVNTTLTKVATEVQALKDSLANVDIPPAAQAALDRLTAAATALDQLNDDATPPTDPTPTPEGSPRRRV